MQNDILPIASRVIKKCGGHQAVADLTGVSLQRVYCWTYSKAKGGTGGVIPYPHQQKLLEAAAKGLFEIGPQDFFTPPTLPSSNAVSPNPQEPQ